MLPLYGDDARFEREEVPFAPAGLAAGSLKSFIKGSRGPNTRVRLSTPGDVLVFAFTEHNGNTRVTQNEDGFEIEVGTERYAFDVNRKGEEILTLHSA